MLVLFDSGTPRKLALFLLDRHTVTEARVWGWANLRTASCCARKKRQASRYW